MYVHRAISMCIVRRFYFKFSNGVLFFGGRFQSGISAPHMLGNQLNPTSSMAQKMSDTLNDELEAHSIFTSADSNTNTENFVGPPLYNKIISSVSSLVQCSFLIS